jgi:ABC-type sulfate transport system permease subunit
MIFFLGGPDTVVPEHEGVLLMNLLCEQMRFEQWLDAQDIRIVFVLPFKLFST